MKKVNREDVVVALNALQNHNSPGSDGFPAEFFKDSWPTVDDVSAAVLQNGNFQELLIN